MKKIYSFLLIILIAISGKQLYAQQPCNAAFTVSVSGLTVNFHPAVTTDTTSTNHFWAFGDGGIWQTISPYHTYATAGTYTVTHILTRFGNGTVICRDTAFMQITLQNDSTCNLQAGFNYTRDTLNWRTFYFYNTSVNTGAMDSLTWNFGDGSSVSTLQNPVHSFASPGIYNVCLTVTRRNTPAGVPPCSATICIPITVVDSNIQQCNIQPFFTFHRDSLNTRIIYFTNSTANLLASDSVRWTFGDGTSSLAINPVHTYANTGTYQVCLRVKRNMPAGAPACVREYCQSLTVTDSTNIVCNLQPLFSYRRDSLNTRIIYFTNATANLLATDSVRWTFGDGTSSLAINPVHTYANAGTYLVCLRVKRNMPAGAAPCIREYCLQLQITDSNSVPCNMQPSFIFRRDSIDFRTIYFTNTTVNLASTDSVRWTFGDGTSSNQLNPAHTYAVAGTYQVCLRLQRPTAPGTTICVREFCLTVTIASPNACNLQANFTNRRDSVNWRTQYFTNTTTGLLSTDSVRWTFGDGTSSISTHAVHTYNAAGWYTVCLRVKRNMPAGAAPCVREICRLIRVDSVNNNNCLFYVDFSSRTDTANNLNVLFTNLSYQQAGATATWRFGDGTTATGWNTSHIYNAPGTYNVCLRVQYANGCIRERCRVIQIPNYNNCFLQPYPNPASSQVSVSVNLLQPFIIYSRIYNSMNMIVRQQQQNGATGFNTVTFGTIGNLPTGIYRIVVNYGQRECRGTFVKY